MEGPQWTGPDCPDRPAVARPAVARPARTGPDYPCSTVCRSVSSSLRTPITPLTPLLEGWLLSEAQLDHKVIEEQDQTLKKPQGWADVFVWVVGS